MMRYETELSCTCRSSARNKSLSPPPSYSTVRRVWSVKHVLLHVIMKLRNSGGGGTYVCHTALSVSVVGVVRMCATQS